MTGPHSRPPTGPTRATHREPTDVTKWVVSGTAALVIATRRDLASALCVGGAVINALLAKLLKRLLKEVPPLRPAHSTQLSRLQPHARLQPHVPSCNPICQAATPCTQAVTQCVQARPAGARLHDPGMPSSHAQAALDA